MAYTADLRTIPSFPDYSATKDGRVWSRPRLSFNGKRIRGRWLTLKVDPYGRPLATMRRNGRGYVKRVCLLVLEAFIGPRPEGLQCRHLDGNSANNQLGNLCWGTKSENERDKIRHGTSNRGSRHGKSKLKEADIPVIRFLRKAANFTYKEIAFHFNVSAATITDICLKRRWKHI